MTPSTATDPGELDTDGRRQRREHNRRAVVEALVSLYEDGTYEPTAAEVAARAGLSARSLFRYFDDTRDLAGAAVAHHVARAQPLLSLDVSAADPLDRRIAGLVRGRLALWEAVGATARVARMKAPVVPMLAAELHRNRAAQRAQVADLFAAEARALGAGGAGVLAAADVLCSFESFDMLRHDQQLPLEAVTEVLTTALRRLLT